jgi:hypothetical protein
MRRTLARLARTRSPYIAAGVVVVIGLAGALVLLVGGNSTTRPTPRPTGASSVRRVAQPAGPNPSESAEMVCAPEAQQDLASALGVATTAVSEPTWADHVYSCRYMYPNGTMALAVKELSSQAETTAYFKSLRAQLGESESLSGVAQGAFVTSDGSLVLRKDYKVLLVDTSSIPEPFGSGFKTRDQVAVGVGITVLGCWTGA